MRERLFDFVFLFQTRPDPFAMVSRPPVMVCSPVTPTTPRISSRCATGYGNWFNW